MLCPELMRKEPTIPPNLIVRSNLAAYLKFQWKHSSIHPNAMFWDYCDIYPLPPLNRKALLEDLCTIYENYGMDCGSRFTIAFFLQIDTLWHWLLIERSHFIHTGKPISELDKEIRQLIEKRVEYYAKLEPSFIFFRDAKEIISTVYSSHIEEFIREMEKDYWTSELTDHVYLSLKRIFNLNLTFDSYHFANFGIKLLRNYVVDEYILSVSSILNLITYMSASRFLPSPQVDFFLNSFFENYLNMSNFGRIMVLVEFLNHGLCDLLNTYELIWIPENVIAALNFSTNKKCKESNIFSVTFLDKSKFALFNQYEIGFSKLISKVLEHKFQNGTEGSFLKTLLRPDIWIKDLTVLAFNRVFRKSENPNLTIYSALYELNFPTENLKFDFNYREVRRFHKAESEKLGNSEEVDDNLIINYTFMRSMEYLVYMNLKSFFISLKTAFSNSADLKKPIEVEENIHSLLKMAYHMNPQIKNFVETLIKPNKNYQKKNLRNFASFTHSIMANSRLNRPASNTEEYKRANEESKFILAVIHGAVVNNFVVNQFRIETLLKLWNPKQIATDLAKIEPDQVIIGIKTIISTIDIFRTRFTCLTKDDENHFNEVGLLLGKNQTIEDLTGESKEKYIHSRTLSFYKLCVVCAIKAQIPQNPNIYIEMRQYYHNNPNACKFFDSERHLSNALDLYTYFSKEIHPEILKLGLLLSLLPIERKLEIDEQMTSLKIDPSSKLKLAMGAFATHYSQNQAKDYFNLRKGIAGRHLPIINVVDTHYNILFSSNYSMLLPLFLNLVVFVSKQYKIDYSWKVDLDIWETFMETDIENEYNKEFINSYSLNLFKKEILSELDCFFSKEIMDDSLWNLLKIKCTVQKEEYEMYPALINMQQDLKVTLKKIFQELEQDAPTYTDYSLIRLPLPKDSKSLFDQNIMKKCKCEKGLESKRKIKPQLSPLTESSNVEKKIENILPVEPRKPKIPKKKNKEMTYDESRVPQFLPSSSSQSESKREQQALLPWEKILTSKDLICNSSGYCYPSLEANNHFVNSFISLIQKRGEDGKLLGVPIRLKQEFIEFLSRKNVSLFFEYSKKYKCVKDLFVGSSLLDIWVPAYPSTYFPEIVFVKRIGKNWFEKIISMKIGHILYFNRFPFVEARNLAEPEYMSLARLLVLLQFSQSNRVDCNGNLKPISVIRMKFGKKRTPFILNGVVTLPRPRNNDLLNYPYLHQFNRLIYNDFSYPLPPSAIVTEKKKECKLKVSISKLEKSILIDKLDLSSPSSTSSDSEEHRPEPVVPSSLILPVPDPIPFIPINPPISIVDDFDFFYKGLLNAESIFENLSNPPASSRILKVRRPIADITENPFDPSYFEKHDLIGEVYVIQNDNFRTGLILILRYLLRCVRIFGDLELSGIFLDHDVAAKYQDIIEELRIYLSKTFGITCQNTQDIMIGLIFYRIVQVGFTFEFDDGQVKVVKIVVTSDNELFDKHGQLDKSKFSQATFKFLKDHNFNFFQFEKYHLLAQDLQVIFSMILGSKKRRHRLVLFSGYVDFLKILRSQGYNCILTHSELEKLLRENGIIFDDVKFLVAFLRAIIPKPEKLFGWSNALDEITGFITFGFPRKFPDGHNAAHDSWMTKEVHDKILRIFPDAVDICAGRFFRADEDEMNAVIEILKPKFLKSQSFQNYLVQMHYL
jgi:hypothetical protein